MLRRWQKPLGGCSALWDPQIGTTLHDVPIPWWGCSGQCPALPRGTARPPPVLSTPPLPEPAWQHLPAGPKRSPRPRAAPFTGPKPGSPLPVNPWWPRAGNCGHVLCRVCDLGAVAKPRGDTEGARGWVPVPPPLTAGAVPAVTGPWLTRLGARCRRGAGSPAGDSRIPRSPARAGRVGSLLHPGWPPPVVTVPSAWWLGNPWG